jgi:hypothetical protein
MNELTRANKITAYWEGEGVAVAVFYKTHAKLATIRSTDAEVIAAGFVMPIGTDEVPVTASQKLEAFKLWISANASAFGYTYDPIDRRAETFKFPAHYDKDTAMEFGKKMLENAFTETLASVQTNVIDKMIKAGHLAEGAQVQYGVGEGVLDITESYSNGFIKYATIDFPVAIAVAGKQVDSKIIVELVSGQIKKPRTIGETVMTMTGIKGLLVEGDVIPKIEPKAKKEDGETAPVEGGETPASKPQA